jgi:hypothetical protein
MSSLTVGLVTALNNGDSCFCAHVVTLRRMPHQLNCLIARTALVVTFRNGALRKHYSIVVCVIVAAGTCLPSCCAKNGRLTPYIKNPLTKRRFVTVTQQRVYTLQYIQKIYI